MIETSHISQIIPSVDPCSGSSPVRTLADCERTGVTSSLYGSIETPASSIATTTGGNLNLLPERAITSSIGFIFSNAENYLELDIYNIDLEDQIGTSDADTVLTKCLDTGLNKWCSLINRNPLTGTFHEGEGKINTPLLNLTKGIVSTHYILIHDYLKQHIKQLNYAVLSGPNLAVEIAQKKPAAAVIANKVIEQANSISELFHNSNLRLYPSNDPQGVSIAGAVKNIIAIGAGIIEGLGLGDNAKAALITRGISETSELIKKAGGNYNSAFGLAGIGDMSLTCSGPHSRNMAYGMKIVKNNNEPPKELVEGLNAINATIALSEKLDLELPIMTSIKKILNKEANIDEIIKKLLSRPIKNEFI